MELLDPVAAGARLGWAGDRREAARGTRGQLTGAPRQLDAHRTSVGVGDHLRLGVAEHVVEQRPEGFEAMR